MERKENSEPGDGFHELLQILFATPVFSAALASFF